MVNWYVHGFKTDSYVKELSEAIRATGNKMKLLSLPPFSTELPKEPSEPFVLYGGTRIVEAASKDSLWHRGVWYNHIGFSWYNNKIMWKDKMLMQRAWYATFDLADVLPYNADDFVFVRPDADLKEFAGEVMTFSGLLKWGNKLMVLNDDPGATMNSRTPIIVGDVLDIVREWRIFVVDSKPIECSRYRSSSKFDPKREFPDEVQKFVDLVIDTYLPSPVIVIDVGVLDDGRMGIVESNCFNSSGWYEADIANVVAAVSDYVKANQ